MKSVLSMWGLNRLSNVLLVYTGEVKPMAIWGGGGGGNGARLEAEELIYRCSRNTALYAYHPNIGMWAPDSSCRP